MTTTIKIAVFRDKPDHLPDTRIPQLQREPTNTTADPQLAAIEIARYVHDLVVDEFFADDELPNIEWLKTKLRDAGMPLKQSAEDEESDSCDIEVYIRAAEQHVKDDDPDHEVGDLQDHLRAIWRLLTPEQRAEFAALSDVRARVELGTGSMDADTAHG